MNRRKLAIAVIVAEVAETGKAGKCAIRAYIETRMSRETFNKACAAGLEIYRRKAGTPGAPKDETGTFWAGR